MIQEKLNSLRYIYYNIKNYGSKDYELTKKNIKYKNKYKGKRCFILGNGPSLNNVDFKLLENEYVFTPNRLVRNERFKELKSNFHVVTDSVFWGNRKELRINANDFLDDLKKLDKDTKLIIPVKAYDCLKRKKLLDNTLFIKKGELFQDGNRVIDMCSLIPFCRTVVQHSIEVAIYMGFSEIYLLGCDGTTIYGIIDEMRGIEIGETHADDDKDGVYASIFKQMANNMKMDDIFYAQYCIFNDYRGLFEYCKNRKIKLYNCTDPTIINTLPFKKLSSVIKK